jgi:copper chaperone CopZ
MKNSLVMFITITLLASVFSFAKVSAQTEGKESTKKYEVKIKTSAFSEMCKNRIESEMKDCKGVLDAYLSLEDQVVTVTYDNESVKSSKLKSLINDIGYDAEVIEDKAVISTANGANSKAHLNF